MSTIKSSDEHLTLNADGSSKDIKLQSNASEKVIVKSTGNVGINNSSPTQRLEINGNSQLNAYDSTSGSGGYSTSGLQIGNAFDAGLSGGNDDRNSIVWNERGLDMLFGTSNTERMRIDYNGNVGIGVVPENNTLGSSLQIGSGGQIIGDTSETVYLGTNFYYNSGFKRIAAKHVAMQSFTDSGNHIFYTAPSDSADSAISLTTAMTMYQAQSGAAVDISMGARWSGDGGGKTDFQTNTNGGVLCRMSSSSTASSQRMWFVNSNGLVGSVSTNGSATVFATSSDYRLKENVNYDWDATTKLKQLKPARFNFIADDTTVIDGFIAHEVQEVVPEAVTGTKDAMRDEKYEVTPAVEEVRDEEGNITTEAVEAVMGTRSVPDYQGIDQSKLVPLLVKTIQELEARITALEA